MVSPWSSFLGWGGPCPSSPLKTTSTNIAIFTHVHVEITVTCKKFGTFRWKFLKRHILPSFDLLMDFFWPCIDKKICIAKIM